MLCLTEMRPLLTSLEAIKECSDLMSQCHLFIDNCTVFMHARSTLFMLRRAQCASAPPPPSQGCSLDCAKQFAVG